MMIVLEDVQPGGVQIETSNLFPIVSVFAVMKKNPI